MRRTETDAPLTEVTVETQLSAVEERKGARASLGMGRLLLLFTSQ